MNMLRPIGIALATFISFQISTADESSREYLELRRMIGGEEFTRALVSCKGLIEKYPRNAYLYDALAEISSYSNDFSAANEYLERRYAEGLDVGFASYGLANLLFQSNNFRESASAYGRALEQGVPAADCGRGLAYSLEKLMGFQEAIALLSQLSLRFPLNPAYSYALALEYWRRKDFPKAKQCLKEAVFRDPKEPKYRDAIAAIMLIDTDSLTNESQIRELAHRARERSDLNGQQFLLSHLLMSKLRTESRVRLESEMRLMLNETQSFGLFRWTSWAFKLLADLSYYDADYKASLRYTELAYLASERSNDNDLIVGILVRQFESYLESGDLESALTSVQKRVEHCRNAGGGDEFLRALNDLAWVYGQMGAYNLALEYAVEALSRVESAGLGARFLYQVETNLGLIQSGIGNHDLALGYFLSAKRHVPNGPMKTMLMAVVHGNIGEAYLQLGQHRQARTHFILQRNLSKVHGYVREEANSFLNLGRFFMLRKQVDSALAMNRLALRLGIRISNVPLQISAKRGIAEVYLVSRHWRGALQEYLDLINVQVQRGVNCLAAKRDLRYDCGQAAHLLAKEKCDVEAFEMAEKSKLLPWKDFRTLPQRSLKQLMPPQLAKSVEDIRRRLEESMRRLASHQSRAGVAFLDERQDLSLLDEIARLELEYSRLVDSTMSLGHDPRRLFDKGQTLLKILSGRFLADSVALIEYVVGKHATTAFYVTAQGISHYEVLAGEGKLKELLRRLSNLTDPDGKTDYVIHPVLARFDQTISRELFDLLLGPVADSLCKLKHLIIVPDGCLSLLPFESLVPSLPNGEAFTPVSKPNYLVETVEVSYALAATLLCSRESLEMTPIKAFLGIGNPKGDVPLDNRQILKIGSASSTEEGQLVSLPGAQREVERISEIIGRRADLLTGKRAKRLAVKSSAGQYCVLHFATHAKYDGRRPMWSGLFLAPGDERSQNDVLRAFEFFNLDLNASLVVMSGCNTGRMEGGGPDDGLVRALQFSGVPAVVASLWTVRDDAALSFMESFYTSLRHGDTKSAALRRAKLELIRAGKTDPFYWAGFVLVGDPTSIDFDRFNQTQMEALESDYGLFIAVLSIFVLTVLISLKFLLNPGTQFAGAKR